MANVVSKYDIYYHGSNPDTQISGGSIERPTFSLNSTNFTIKVDEVFHRPLIICVRFSHKNNSYFMVNRF